MLEMEINEKYVAEMRRFTEEGIKQGWDNAFVEWKKMALACVIKIAQTREEFTVNAVRHLVETSPLKTHDNRAMGGVIKTAQKMGIIAPTGKSIPSKVGHKVPIQVWKSLVYKK